MALSPSPFLLAPPPSIHPSTNPEISSSSSQASTPYSASAINGPYLGVVLVVLLITFFLMAAFSVYMRRFAFSLGSEAGPGTDRSSRGRGRGLDRTAIDGLPIVVYHCEKGESKDEAAALAHEWSRRSDCVVCLTDFQEAEKLRLLPRCEHCFHPECIDMWLGSHNTCPLCRRSLLPPPPPPQPLPANNEVCISVQAGASPASVAPSNSASVPSSATS